MPMKKARHVLTERQCPSCKQWSRQDAWQLIGLLFGCDDCGTHDGTQCPLCNATFDNALTLFKYHVVNPEV